MFAEFLGTGRLEQFATFSVMSILRAVQFVQRGRQKDLLLFLIEYIQMQGKIIAKSVIRTQVAKARPRRARKISRQRHDGRSAEDGNMMARDLNCSLLPAELRQPG